MNRYPAVLLVLCVFGGAVAWGQPKPREVADEDVERSIAEAVRFLYAQQHKEGHWQTWHRDFDRDGHSVLALFALLEAGESPKDPRIVKALEAAVKFKPRRRKTYVIAVRVMAFALAGAGKKDSPYHATLLKDVAWLSKGVTAKGGAWDYDGPHRFGDNSCSQFALLALWEADRVGVKTKPSLKAIIRAVERTWVRRQQDDGGWKYPGQPNVESTSTPPMTAAGIASLYVCQDVLSRASGPYKTQRQKQLGWDYLAKHLPADYYSDGYLAFCVQRIGMASGRKFIGNMDWYAAGAAQYCKPAPYGRRYRGKWGPLVRASFELIFLARGRLPLTFNKLRHGTIDNWNHHSRDIAGFTEYMRRNFERRMRWQIVRIDENVETMLDAPILLVSGAKEPQFSQTDWDKLREYTLRGGTVLFMPIGRSKTFADAVRAGLKDLYAKQRKAAGGEYELTKLPADHPLYTVHQVVKRGPLAAPMWGVSDGTRLLAVLCERDLAASWQKRAVATRKDDYSLGVNFLLYATGANALRTRMRPVFVHRNKPARHHVKIAWLRHGGNWNTQPYAIDSLSQKLRSENRMAVELVRGAAIDTESLGKNHLAWMTGSKTFELTEAETAALRTFMDGGGVLFVNAVGGASAFARSARTMLTRLYPPGTVRTGSVAAGSPLLTGKLGEFRGPILPAKLARTKALYQMDPRGVPPLKLYLKGGRIVAILATSGIHDTLDGHTAHAQRSYMPRAARDLAANIVLYARMDKAEENKPGDEDKGDAKTDGGE